MEFKTINTDTGSRDKVAKLANGWLLKTYDLLEIRDDSGTKITGYRQYVSTNFISDKNHDIEW